MIQTDVPDEDPGGFGGGGDGVGFGVDDGLPYDASEHDTDTFRPG